MRRIVCNNIEDIDSDLAHLFRLKLFAKGGDRVKRSLFEYICSFYSEEHSEKTHDEATASASTLCVEEGIGGFHFIATETTAQFQCNGDKLLIARSDQALEIQFVDGYLNVSLWHRLVGKSISDVDLVMVSNLVVQISAWLHSELMSPSIHCRLLVD